MKRRTNGEKSLVKKEETSEDLKDKDTKSAENLLKQVFGSIS